MHKTVMACLAVFLTTETPAAWAQTDTAHTDTSVIGMPIYTADGMKIGQVSFFQMTTEADNPYGSKTVGSKYQGQRGPTPSRYFENWKK